MSKSFSSRLVKNNHGVHAPHPNMDATLCGDAYEGYEPSGLSECKSVAWQNLTCPTCLDMVKLAKGIPDRFIH
jgi:hypothetical protein